MIIKVLKDTQPLCSSVGKIVFLLIDDIERVSLYSPGWLGTCYEDHADLELTDLLASAF